MKTYRVVITEEAEADLALLQDFAMERELASSTPDLDVVERMLDAIDHALRLLAFSPHSCRRAARAVHTAQRELIIPFGRTGFVAAFEIREEAVLVCAVRHQLEEDFRH